MRMTTCSPLTSFSVVSTNCSPPSTIQSTLTSNTLTQSPATATATTTETTEKETSSPVLIVSTSTSTAATTTTTSSVHSKSRSSPSTGYGFKTIKSSLKHCRLSEPLLLMGSLTSPSVGHQQLKHQKKHKQNQSDPESLSKANVTLSPPPLPPHRNGNGSLSTSCISSSLSSSSSGIARSAKVKQPKRHESASVLYYDSSKSSSSTCSGGSLRSSLSNVDIVWDPKGCNDDQPPPPPPRHSSKTPPPPLPPKSSNLTDKKLTNKSKGLSSSTLSTKSTSNDRVNNKQHGVHSIANKMVKPPNKTVTQNGHSTGTLSPQQSQQQASTSSSSTLSPNYNDNSSTINWNNNSYNNSYNDLKAIQKRAVLEFYLKHKRKQEQEQQTSNGNTKFNSHTSQSSNGDISPSHTIASNNNGNISNSSNSNNSKRKSFELEIRQNGLEWSENRLTSNLDSPQPSKASSGKVELVVSNPSNGLPNTSESFNCSPQSSRTLTGLTGNCSPTTVSPQLSSSPPKPLSSQLPSSPLNSSSSSSSSSTASSPPPLPPLPLKSHIQLPSLPPPSTTVDTTMTATSSPPETVITSQSSPSYSPSPPPLPPPPTHLQQYQSPLTSTKPLLLETNLNHLPVYGDTPSIPPLPSLPPLSQHSKTPSNASSNTLDSDGCYTGPGSSGTLTSTCSSSSGIGSSTTYESPSLFTVEKIDSSSFSPHPPSSFSHLFGPNSTTLKVSGSIKNDTENFTIVTTASCSSSTDALSSSCMSYQRPVTSSVTVLNLKEQATATINHFQYQHHHKHSQQQNLHPPHHTARLNDFPENQESVACHQGHKRDVKKSIGSRSPTNTVVSLNDSRQYHHNGTVNCLTKSSDPNNEVNQLNGDLRPISDKDLEPWSHRRLWPRKGRSHSKSGARSKSNSSNGSSSCSMIIETDAKSGKSCQGASASSDGYSSGSLSSTSSTSSLDLIESFTCSSNGQLPDPDLVTRLTERLNCLKSEQGQLSNEIEANEKLGNSLLSKLKVLGVTCQESEKIAIHLEEIEKITRLLLSLSGRLRSIENDIRSRNGKSLANGHGTNVPGSNGVNPPNTASSSPNGSPHIIDGCVDGYDNHTSNNSSNNVNSNNPEIESLLFKRNNLSEQLEEAIQLKESIDRRSQIISDRIIVKYFKDSSEDVDSFVRFIQLKSKLIVEEKEVSDKIEAGEKQLLSLTNST